MKTVCLFALFAGCTAALATPGVLVCHFDTPEMSAAINDFGALGPQVAGFRHLLEPGCPADPAPGVLEAGITDPSGSFTLPIAGDTSLRQGTLELWSKTDWDFGDRSLHVFATIPLLGGYWNSISIGYHGLIGPETEVFESNIMDGVDHPLVVNAGPEGLFWRRGEWHHVALCWTEHSQRLFGDGKLLAATAYSEPLFITAPVGKLHVGCPSTAFGGPLQGLVDELRLCTVPLYAGMDAFPLPEVPIPQKAIIDGDALCLSIAAASIVAKVTRDRIMEREDAVYPGYGFARHKGYGTREHLLNLRRYGPCPILRLSFAPVRQWQALDEHSAPAAGQA